MAIYDRASELKAFDTTKTGVKGLVDAGCTEIPRIFINPNPSCSALNLTTTTTTTNNIPIIDLSNPNRPDLVQELGAAAEAFGIFRVVGHGIPMEMLDEIILGVRRFHEEDAEVKKEYYTRDPERKVQFNSNIDLYQSPAANWRDTFICTIAPEPPAPEELPLACREIIIQYGNHVSRLGGILFELLSEALGLDRNHLSEMECAKGLHIAGHYYPSCPEPHLTIGISKHSDPGFLTVLHQDHIGGLQVLHENKWIDAPAVPGALIVNMGNLLQLITNDKLKSVEHRVLASKVGPRISVAGLFTTRSIPSSRLYGPIKELLSDDDLPIYKDVSVKDYNAYSISKGLDGQSALNTFRL